MEETSIILREKYGLSEKPEEIIVNAWIKKTNRYIMTGMDPEKAGKASAIALFSSDYGVRHSKDTNQNVVDIIDSASKY